jgi:hypothetical protein
MATADGMDLVCLSAVLKDSLHNVQSRHEVFKLHLDPQIYTQSKVRKLLN